ncbi:pyridoxamine 5'-phosphate oxidase family protein [Sinomicrobium weinanense]|uniref:Pyridoxamine 5'-phosphate oxidase family protein n=1 Tax=Sinomicrobium weinanense TaxID=2842200 RepID=A0A926JS83_9FLAO|nr:pyridoxamine 5'-phosphate oxidase family protein [Sinomicrobium weinanense]MBC9796562.1 pyridoxamine 5'-phosphate oxidase family protein [Sinomicrobium weinanense]MBU3123051.1 pyridoxamine 5'-phosphate oxidase family protein [Sinomicrobium weinanense]
MPNYETTPLNKLVRGPKRASYDQEQIYRILDKKFLCHVAYTWNGKAIVIPTAYGRKGDRLYIHGSLKNRMMSCLSEAGEACISVTHLDGLVLARSAFHHSANYRSVNIFGKVRKLEGDEEKMQALECILNHMVPGHWKHVRQPNDKELRATLVLEIAIDSASAKIRSGGVADEKEDLDLPIWAGVIPITETVGEPEYDPFLPEHIKAPASVLNYVKNHQP